MVSSFFCNLADNGRPKRAAAAKASGELHDLYHRGQRSGSEAGSDSDDSAGSGRAPTGPAGPTPPVSAPRAARAPAEDAADDSYYEDATDEPAEDEPAEDVPGEQPADIDINADQAALAVPPPIVMVNYDVDDGVDDKDASHKTSNLKLEFDKTDVKFWFCQLEMHLNTAGIKSQWTKRLLLHKQLPSEIVMELKDLLRKDKSEAGAQPYKDLKDRILHTFGQNKEDAYLEVEGYLMTGKPSQLAKKLINRICEKHPYLTDCCASGIVAGMWRSKLPFEVRQQVAGMSLEGETAMKATLDKADSVWLSLQRRNPAPAHAPAAPIAAAQYDFDTSADEPALQVAAVGRGRGQTSRGRRGQPGSRPNQPRKADRGNPHPDGPPAAACNTHWKYGRSAFTCRKKETCPWAHLAEK